MRFSARHSFILAAVLIDGDTGPRLTGGGDQISFWAFGALWGFGALGPVGLWAMWLRAFRLPALVTSVLSRNSQLAIEQKCSNLFTHARTYRTQKPTHTTHHLITSPSHRLPLHPHRPLSVCSISQCRSFLHSVLPLLLEQFGSTCQPSFFHPPASTLDVVSLRQPQITTVSPSACALPPSLLSSASRRSPQLRDCSLSLLSSPSPTRIPFQRQCPVPRAPCPVARSSFFACSASLLTGQAVGA